MKIKNFFKIIGRNKRKPDIYLEFFMHHEEDKMCEHF